ncbi:hypothetical protein CMEL01_00549 [Colletotrichum melonis]|uniref:Uncharacterized protein n=1 Tax=Colletotrichum melonis TaxID=1209925 RepID=A0AAI9V1D4_9PEZI|nr:hypothetical protein CMEL01_00549 [Colletotrichum melonis]
MGSSVTRCTAWTSIPHQTFCFSQLGSRFLHRRLAWHCISHNGTRLDITDTALGRDVACYERVFFPHVWSRDWPCQRRLWFMQDQSNIDGAHRSHPRSWWVGEAEGAEVMEAEHCVTLKMPDLQAGIYFPIRRFFDDGGCDRRDETIWPATRCITVAKFPASFPTPILNDMYSKGQKEAQSRCSWRRWAVGFYVLHNRRSLTFDLGT